MVVVSTKEAQELEACYSYKGEVFIDMELIEEGGGFGLVFISFQCALLG